jgi:predicted AAA+ superfamily ATPase
MELLKRKQVFEGSEGESFFLWDARQTGKSTLLQNAFPKALWFDLLLADEYQRMLMNPTLLRETVLAQPELKTVIIDEIQRIPDLLNEIHWLMTHTNTQFIMSGSSPRKIIRSGTNLLGGRALRYELYPFISQEIPNFNIETALNNGMIPRHYLMENPKRRISAYIGNYLQDEIVSEARLRNVQLFALFLKAAAFSNGEMVNYSNIATDCGVSAPTIKEYFQILEDTLIGRMVPAFQKKPKRRVITAPKFYFFDIGVVNHLMNRRNISLGSTDYGNAFEHFIYLELYAHSKYSGIEYPISYWRTTSQLEIDFVLGDHEVAIEVKSTNVIQTRHLNGLKAFQEEYEVKHALVICNEPRPRVSGNITILPWQIFLERLWKGELIQ